MKLKDPIGIIIKDDLFGELKIQLTMQINFISSLETREIRIMDSKSDKVEIMIGNEADDIIRELFESFKNRYLEGLETKMKWSHFVFESVDLLYYSLHKISLNRGGLYIDSPSWLKYKRAAINPKREDNEWFKYAITITLNHEIIKRDPRRISKIKPFIDQYKWRGTKFLSHPKDWENFEQKNKTIALNVFIVPYPTEKKNEACIQIKV